MAEKVDYEGDQRPYEKVICERGATLLEEYEQRYGEIDNPYESHVQAQAKILRLRSNFEVYVVDRLFYLIEALKQLVCTVHSVARVEAHIKERQIAINRHYTVHLFVIEVS